MIDIGKIFGWGFAAAGALCLILAITTWSALSDLSFRATDLERAMLTYGGSIWLGSAISAAFFSWVSFAICRLLAGSHQSSRLARPNKSEDFQKRQASSEAATPSDNPFDEPVENIASEPSVLEFGSIRIVVQANGSAIVYRPDGPRKFTNRVSAIEYAKEKQVALP